MVYAINGDELLVRIMVGLLINGRRKSTKYVSVISMAATVMIALVFVY